jgi:hypothetical protein
MILPKSQWPKYLLKFKEIKGISYGKCKVDKKTFSDHAAHAHCGPYIHNGWICVRSKALIRNRLMMLHEVAHLLVNYKYGHNDTWRKTLLRIGGTLDPFPTTGTRVTVPYHKKKRK